MAVGLMKLSELNRLGWVYSIEVYSVCGGELINKGVNVVGTGSERCRHTVEV